MANEENTSSVATPCPGCRFLGRKCDADDDCIFAPLFRQNDSTKLENLASANPNPNPNRKDAVESLHKEENTSSVARPCTACMFLRQKCDDDCLFAPIFPQNNPKRFDKVIARHGADVIKKLLMSILETRHKFAVKSHHDNRSSDMVMPPPPPDKSQPMIGVSAGVASVHASPQPQPQPQQRAKDKDKQVASDAHNDGELVIGNPRQLLPGQQQVWQMAPTASANRGQLLIRDPQTHGYRADQQQMARISSADTSQMLFRQPQPHGYLRIADQQQISSANASQMLIREPRPPKYSRIVDRQQLARISSANRGQLIIRDPQTHGYRVDQQQMARISSADTSQMIIRQPQPHGYLRIADQQQMAQISSANTSQMVIREPQPPKYSRIVDLQQLARISSANRGQLIIRDPQTHGYRVNQQQMARISFADTSRMLFRQPQPHGYLRIADQQQMAQTSSANTSQMLIREPQPHKYRRIVDRQQLGRISSANRGQLMIRDPHTHKYPRIADQEYMDLMSWADRLSREPQQHGFTRNVDQQQLGRISSVDTGQNQQPYFPPAYQDSEVSSQNQQLQLHSDILSSDPHLRSQMMPQTQQHQQIVNSVTSQIPYFPPDYTDSELSLQMVLPGQQNQQLQLHSDILSIDPHLRSQMMPQPQQDQQSHSQEQYSQPVLDQHSAT